MKQNVARFFSPNYYKLFVLLPYFLLFFFFKEIILKFNLNVVFNPMFLPGFRVNPMIQFNLGKLVFYLMFRISLQC